MGVDLGDRAVGAVAQLADPCDDVEAEGAAAQGEQTFLLGPVDGLSKPARGRRAFVEVTRDVELLAQSLE